MSPVPLDSFLPSYFTSGFAPNNTDGFTKEELQFFLETPSSLDVSGYLNNFTIMSNFPSCENMNTVFNNIDVVNPLSVSIPLQSGFNSPYLILDTKCSMSPSTKTITTNNVISDLGDFTGNDVLDLLNIINSQNTNFQGVSTYYLNDIVDSNPYTFVQYVVSLHGFQDVTFNIQCVINKDMQMLVSYTNINTNESPLAYSFSFSNLKLGWKGHAIVDKQISLTELISKSFIFNPTVKTLATLIQNGATAGNFCDYNPSSYSTISSLVRLGFSTSQIVQQVINRPTPSSGIDVSNLVTYYTSLIGNNNVSNIPARLCQDGLNLDRFLEYYETRLPTGKTKYAFAKDAGYNIHVFANLYSGDDFYTNANAAGFTFQNILDFDIAAMPSLIRLKIVTISQVAAYYNANINTLKLTYATIFTYLRVCGYTIIEIQNAQLGINNNNGQNIKNIKDAGYSFAEFVESNLYTPYLDSVAIAFIAGYSAQEIYDYYSAKNASFLTGLDLLFVDALAPLVVGPCKFLYLPELFSPNAANTEMIPIFNFDTKLVSNHFTIETAYTFSKDVYKKSTAFLELTGYSFDAINALRTATVGGIAVVLNKVSIAYAITNKAGGTITSALKLYYTYAEMYDYRESWDDVFQAGYTMSELIAANIGINAANYVSFSNTFRPLPSVSVYEYLTTICVDEKQIYYALLVGGYTLMEIYDLFKSRGLSPVVFKELFPLSIIYNTLVVSKQDQETLDGIRGFLIMELQVTIDEIARIDSISGGNPELAGVLGLVNYMLLPNPNTTQFVGETNYDRLAPDVEPNANNLLDFGYSNQEIADYFESWDTVKTSNNSYNYAYSSDNIVNAILNDVTLQTIQTSGYAPSVFTYLLDTKLAKGQIGNGIYTPGLWDPFNNLDSFTPLLTKSDSFKSILLPNTPNTNTYLNVDSYGNIAMSSSQQPFTTKNYIPQLPLPNTGVFSFILTLIGLNGVSTCNYKFENNTLYINYTFSFIHRPHTSITAQVVIKSDQLSRTNIFVQYVSASDNIKTENPNITSLIQQNVYDHDQKVFIGESPTPTIGDLLNKQYYVTYQNTTPQALVDAGFYLNDFYKYEPTIYNSISSFVALYGGVASISLYQSIRKLSGLSLTPKAFVDYDSSLTFSQLSSIGYTFKEIGNSMGLAWLYGEGINLIDIWGAFPNLSDLAAIPGVSETELLTFINQDIRALEKAEGSAADARTDRLLTEYMRYGDSLTKSQIESQIGRYDSAFGKIMSGKSISTIFGQSYDAKSDISVLLEEKMLQTFVRKPDAGTLPVISFPTTGFQTAESTPNDSSMYSFAIDQNQPTSKMFVNNGTIYYSPLGSIPDALSMQPNLIGNMSGITWQTPIGRAGKIGSNNVHFIQLNGTRDLLQVNMNITFFTESKLMVTKYSVNGQPFYQIPIKIGFIGKELIQMNKLLLENELDGAQYLIKFGRPTAIALRGLGIKAEDLKTYDNIRYTAAYLYSIGYTLQDIWDAGFTQSTDYELIAGQIDPTISEPGIPANTRESKIFAALKSKGLKFDQFMTIFGQDRMISSVVFVLSDFATRYANGSSSFAIIITALYAAGITLQNVDALYKSNLTLGNFFRFGYQSWSEWMSLIDSKSISKSNFYASLYAGSVSWPDIFAFASANDPDLAYNLFQANTNTQIIPYTVFAGLYQTGPALIDALKQLKFNNVRLSKLQEWNTTKTLTSKDLVATGFAIEDIAQTFPVFGTLDPRVTLSNILSKEGITFSLDDPASISHILIDYYFSPNVLLSHNLSLSSSRYLQVWKQFGLSLQLIKQVLQNFGDSTWRDQGEYNISDFIGAYVAANQNITTNEVIGNLIDAGFVPLDVYKTLKNGYIVRTNRYTISGYLLTNETTVDKTFDALTSPGQVFIVEQLLTLLGIDVLRREGLLEYYLSQSNSQPGELKYAKITPYEMLLANNNDFNVLKNAGFTTRDINADPGIISSMPQRELLSKLLQLYSPAQVATTFTRSELMSAGITDQIILDKIGSGSLFGPSSLTESEIQRIFNILGSE